MNIPLWQKLLSQRDMEYLKVDRDLRILEISSGVKLLAELPEEIDLGKDVREGFPELFGSEKSLQEVMSGQQMSFELQCISRKGDRDSPIYFDISVLNNNEEGGLLVLFNDVTETMEMKQKLVQSSNRANLLLSTITANQTYIEQLIRSMADALLVTNISGNIKTVNQATIEMFGYSESELIRQPISLIITETEWIQTVSKNLKEEQYVEVQCRKKTGEQISVAFSCAIIDSDIADLKNRLYIGRDITERKRMEAALQQANSQLTTSVKKLEQRNREMQLLTELSQLLQACFTLSEAYTVIAQKISLLFPGLVGGVFAIEAEKNLIEVVATWGNLPIVKEKQFVLKGWCGQKQQRTNEELAQLLCQHLHPSSDSRQHCCLPMMMQGESIGLLYLSSLESGQLTPDTERLAVSVAEHITLALANLRLRETLRTQSIQDPLTGLFNRRYLEETAAREIERAKGSQNSLGMILLDVDHFKRFNDTFGHQAGDTVLREVGRFLNRNIRGKDLACRYGGEEFIVIIPEATLDYTIQRAQMLRSGIKSLRIEHDGQLLGSITSSFGVACFPEHGLTLQAIIAAADTALYRAKASGRDRVISA
ncbi:MAG: diguanylate cyclase [Hormoscilla sp.]